MEQSTLSTLYIVTGNGSNDGWTQTDTLEESVPGGNGELEVSLSTGATVSPVSQGTSLPVDSFHDISTVEDIMMRENMTSSDIMNKTMTSVSVDEGDGLVLYRIPTDMPRWFEIMKHV